MKKKTTKLRLNKTVLSQLQLNAFKGGKTIAQETEFCGDDTMPPFGQTSFYPTYQSTPILCNLPTIDITSGIDLTCLFQLQDRTLL